MVGQFFGQFGLTVAMAVAVSLFLMHVVVPSSLTPRHMVLIAPAWVLLAASGLRQLGQRITASRPGVPRLVAAAPFLVLGIFTLGVLVFC